MFIPIDFMLDILNMMPSIYDTESIDGVQGEAGMGDPRVDAHRLHDLFFAAGDGVRPEPARWTAHGADADAVRRRHGRPGDRRRDRQCGPRDRSEEHTSELQSLMRISYAVFC